MIKMIRDDIKCSLINLDLDSIFLKNRPGIDPDSYRVGLVGEELLVWNPKTNLIMDYYFDDIENDWFDIGLFYKFNDGYIEPNKYFINRDGILYSKYTNSNLNIMKKEAYPSYNLKYESLNNNRTAHCKRAQVHILLAKIFIPNLDPEINVIVDHINRDKYCFELSNLRWTSISKNSKNIDSKSAQEKVYAAYSDRNYENNCLLINERSLLDFGYKKGFIKNSISNKKYPKAYNYYWKIIPISVLNYLEKLNLKITEVDDTMWKESYIPKVYCHPLGIIRIGNNLSVGIPRTKEDKSGYRVIMCGGKKYSVHRIIAGVFLNNNEPIKRSLEVDHISTDRIDNRVENLQIVSHSENMKNIKTRQKLSKGVIDPEGRYFISISECSDYYGVSRSIISRWIKDSTKDFKLAKQKQ